MLLQPLDSGVLGALAPRDVRLLLALNNRVVANGSPLSAHLDNVARMGIRAGYHPVVFGYTDQAADPRELSLFGQEIFQASQAGPGLDDPAYLKARADAKRLAGPEGIDALLETDHLDALIAWSGPSGIVDPVNGTRVFGPPSGLAAVAGYPHLTVPMGYVSGLPVGLSFMGPAWSEARLLSLGYAFEQLSHARRDPTFPARVASRPEIGPALDP